MINRTPKLMLISSALLLLNCQTREQERAQRLRDAPSDLGTRMEGHTSLNDSTASAAAAMNGSQTPSVAPTATLRSITEKLNDAQIAAITEGASSTEIAAAELAKTKSKHEAVAGFARMMLEDHGEATRKQAKLKVATAESTLSRQLQDQGKNTLEQLRSKNGTEFERAYMQAQVDAHQKLLETLDRDLITQVEDGKLEAYLKELRSTVEAHLTQARMSLRGVTVSDDTTPAPAVHAP